MEFVLKPSLEHMALVKIVTSFWNHNDVRDLIAIHKFTDPRSSDDWKKDIEKKIIEKVSQLSLPQLFKKKLLGFIKPISIEVYTWMKYNDKYLHENLSAELCWTSQGTIDKKKTAEVLIRDDNLGISTRYKLACLYCLEDNIVELWNSMTEVLKKSVLHEFPIIDFWSRVIKRKRFAISATCTNEHISYKNVFHLSAHEGNKVAVKYFLQNLTIQEKERSLVKAAKKSRQADTLCFLLTQIKEEQQIEVFENDPYGVLCCFLQWPWQSLFIGVANRFWNFLPKCYFYPILDSIICKVENDFEDCNYQKLFQQFWQNSPNALKDSFIDEVDKNKLAREFWEGDPNDLKNSFIDEVDKNKLLHFLFRIRDRNTIRLILKDVPFAVKENLVYSGEISTFIENSIHDNRWDFLQFFIRELLPSKFEMLNFKREFEMGMRPYFKHSYFAKNKFKQAMHKSFERNKQKWDQIFILPDDSLFKNEKRSIEGGECSSSKRFNSLH